MTMKLLYDVAEVVKINAADPDRAGLEALRLLRGAGLTWRDLLGEPYDEDHYSLGLLRYGHTPPVPAVACGRAIMHAAAHALPFDLAIAALLKAMPTLSAANTQALLTLTRRLMDAHEQGTAAAHCAATSPVPSSASTSWPRPTAG